jgi:hypothetical protein
MNKKLFLFLFCILWAVPGFAQTFDADPDSIPFALEVYYTGGVHQVSIFCTDLDGDNDFDIAIVDDNGSYPYIMINNGNGMFLDKIYVQSGAFPKSVFCADVDGNGYPDLIVACHNII